MNFLLALQCSCTRIRFKGQGWSCRAEHIPHEAEVTVWSCPVLHSPAQSDSHGGCDLGTLPGTRTPRDAQVPNAAPHQLLSAGWRGLFEVFSCSVLLSRGRTAPGGSKQEVCSPFTHLFSGTAFEISPQVQSTTLPNHRSHLGLSQQPRSPGGHRDSQSSYSHISHLQLGKWRMLG